MTRVRIKSSLSLCLVVIVVICFLAGISGTLAAESQESSSPQQQLKAGIDSLIEALSDESFKGEAHKKLLEEKLVQLFKQHFNMSYTSQMCLGRHWRKLSRKEKDDFVSLFTDLLKSAYIGRVDEYSGETVRYIKEILLGSKALVKTMVISKGKEIPVDYKMINRTGSWQVYDVIIEGVSMVRNYRSQFSSILSKKKFADLLDQIRDKISGNQAEKDAVKEPQKG